MERLFREGRRSSSSLLSVLVMPSQDSKSTGRCAYVAGKKLGVAPLRSRCKRVMRATSCELGAPWDGLDVVFIAKRRIANADHSYVVKDMRKALEKAGVL